MHRRFQHAAPAQQTHRSHHYGACATRFGLWLILLFVAGCGTTPPPAALPTTVAPSVIALPTLLAAPQLWVGRETTLIAPINTTNAERMLVLPNDDGLRVWLAQPLSAPQQQRLRDNLGFVKVRGQLSPPGGYGSNGDYAYQFVAQSATVIEVQPLSVATLADQRSALNGVLVAVGGAVVSTPTEALLVERISAGGVPDATAPQIKLAGPLPGAIQAQLQRGGTASYGAVEIVGWWADNELAVLQVVVKTPAR